MALTCQKQYVPIKNLLLILVKSRYPAIATTKHDNAKVRRRINEFDELEQPLGTSSGSRLLALTFFARTQASEAVFHKGLVTWWYGYAIKSRDHWKDFGDQAVAIL